MTRKIWYAIALLLPMLPLLCMVLGFPFFMPIFGSMLMLGSVFAALPYLGFYIGILRWMKNKSAEEVKRASWRFPLIFTLIFGVFWTLVFTFSPDYGAGNPLVAAFLLAGFCLPIGYLYVCLTHGLTWLFLKWGWIKD